MMAEKWTDKQLEIIETRNKNILVSAAAGSGKTTVLVERIKRLIIDDGVSVDQILVATFTNAATSDMKEKITKAIQGAISEKPDAAKFLKNQLDKVYMANINTFHAFAISVIRRYFYIINIDPDFKICDDAERAILQSDALDEVFEERFESNDAEFIEFIKTYCTVRTEKRARDMIIDLYEKIQSLPEPYEWLKSHVEALDNSGDGVSLDLQKIILRNVSESLSKALKMLESVSEILKENKLEGLTAKSLADISLVQDILNSADEGDFDAVSTKISAFKFTTFSVTKEEREKFDEIKEHVNSIRNVGKKYVTEVKSEYFAHLISEDAGFSRHILRSLRTLQDLVVRFHAIFKEKKEEKSLLDFNDIEHYALKILKEPAVAEEYRSKFKYIFVDEYQDSNILQETIVNCIKRDDNVFMVGDVKQSIYRFRLAEPDIFIRKYEEYKDSTDGKNLKIDLNTNFRCKKYIIKAVNDICSTIMPYDEDAELKQGVSDAGKLDYPVELHLVETKEIEADETYEGADVDWIINDLKKVELEATIITLLIQKALESKIYDEKAEGERDVTLNDIVILSRGIKNYGDKLCQTLMEHNIPAFIDDSGGYFDTIEIDIFMNLLRVIDNKKRDIPLISVLYSKMMNFSAEELSKIRIANRECSFYKAFRKYVNHGDDVGLRQKCLLAYEKIEEWRSLTQIMPLDELVWKLMWETGYYVYAGALPAGEQRQANLRALVDKTLKYSQMRHDGLYGFIQYAEMLRKRDVQVGQARLVSEGDNVVRIMTIHKSKGLEFPVVILAGLGKRFAVNREKSDVRMHKDIGVTLPFYTPRERTAYKTILQNIIEGKNKKESMEEEARILYVALTRAKDKLFLVGTTNDADKLIAKHKFDDGSSASSYLDMIMPVALAKGLRCEIYTRAGVVMKKIERLNLKDNLKKRLTGVYKLPQDEAINEIINKRLSYEYPNKKALSSKSKYSVSELGVSKAIEFRSKAAAVPVFLQGKKKLTGAEIGTAIHVVMERMDFRKAYELFSQSDEVGYAYIEALIAELKEKVILLPELAEAIDLKRVAMFVKSDIGVRIAKADKVYKEASFNVIKEIDGIESIVQGVIDCYFEEDGEYVLVDFKSNYVADSQSLGELKEVYATQIELYSEALEVASGVKVKEKYLYLFSQDKAVKI